MRKCRVLTYVMTSTAIVAVTAVGSPRVSQAQQQIATRPQTPDGLQAAEALLARRITITLRDVPLDRAIDSVARVAEVPLQYRLEVVQRYTAPVTLVVRGGTLGEVFDKLLANTALRLMPTHQGHLALVGSERMNDSIPARGTVDGSVADSANGQKLNGATVKVQGTKLTVVTTDSGRFTLRDVPAGEHVLEVRLFGYRPVTRIVTVTGGGQARLRLVMTPVPNVLSGVVTTATGTQRRIEVGNDITTLNVDSIRQVAPITSVTDLLETRVPGMTIQHTSGDPGNPSRIRLRGAGSITGNNDPIVIVDGIRVYGQQSDMRNGNLAGSASLHTGTSLGQNSGSADDRYATPSPLDQIDPSSIETIEVFKGPSASALYGSDAANGVIVITTKRGRAGPTQWNTVLSQGVNWMPGRWPTHYYRFGFGLLNQQTGSPFCLWYDVTCEVDSLVAYQALNDSRYSVFGHGSDQQGTLTISGGSSVFNYSLTGGATKTLGLLKLPAIEQQRYEKFYGPIPRDLLHPDQYQTWSGAGSFAAQPMPAMRVTLVTSLFHSDQHQGSLSQAVQQLQGVYIDPTQLSSTPLITNDVERATSVALTSNYGLLLDWHPISWLPLTATGGLNTVQRTDEALVPFGVNNVAPNTPITTGVDTNGYYGLGRASSQVKSFSVGTTLPAGVLTAAVGAQVNNMSTADVSASTWQLAPGVSRPTNFNFGAQGSFSQRTSSLSTYGWHVEPRLNFHSRFFVAPGFRLDGGSASGSRSGLTGFPKIDFSYLAVDPDNPKGWLTLFRPRMAFGYAGTQPSPTDKLRLLNSDHPLVSLDGSTFVPIVALSSLGNTQLRPERSRELEGGFDVYLWKNRLQLTYSQYNKTRDDAIIQIPIAPSVATLWTFAKNIGVVRNTGVEVKVDAQILESRALGWTVSGNLSSDHNVVVRLNPGQSTLQLGDTRVQAGYPLFGEWRVPVVAFADANQNGVIDATEVTYGDSAVFVGQPQPKYQMNLSTGVVVLNGRLSANAAFAYENGLTQFNGGAADALVHVPDAPGTPFAVQAAVVAAGAGGAFTKRSNIGLIQTVSTFRFNSLSINYNLPTAVSSRLRVPHATLALQGSNLGLHTNYRGKDPGVNTFSTVGSSGDLTADYGQLPQPRTWWLRLTLGN